MRPLSLCLLILLAILAGIYQVTPSAAFSATALGVWSDDYGSRSIVDQNIVPGPSTSVRIDVNVTNVPKFIGGDATNFNGFDISVQYDPVILRVPSANRFVFNANGEDTIVSVTPVREPTLAEKNLPLTPFPDLNSLSVKFIDLDGNTRLTIGETLVFDANDNGLVDTGETVVSETPTRAASANEIGKALLTSGNLEFNDASGEGVYDIGEMLVYNLSPGDGLLSVPSLGTGAAAFKLPTCHFYEGCLFDDTSGTPLDGRIIFLLARSCDEGCPTVTAGMARLALVLVGTPLSIPETGLSGTLFQLSFRVEAGGSTRIDIIFADLTNAGLPPIPHTRLQGYFSTVQARQVAVMSVAASLEDAVEGDLISITVTLRNFDAVPETISLDLRLNITLLEGGRQVLIPGKTTVSSVFSWDTNGFQPGIYIVNASAPLAGDVFPDDNVLAIETVKLRRAPDAFVSELIVEEAGSGRTVAQGRPLSIQVKIGGNRFSSTSLEVSVFYNTTLIATTLMSLGVLTNIGDTVGPVIPKWNTTSLPEGTYVMSARVKAQQGETETGNNLLELKGTVVIKTGLDVAVLNVSPAPEEVLQLQRDVVFISVAVANYGPTAESVRVTASVNGTIIADVSDSVPARREQFFTISWGTQNQVVGVYNVTSTVRLTSGAQELNSQNNDATSSILVRVKVNRPPNVVFTHNAVVNVNTSVQFDGSASADPDGSFGETFSWDFGDGNGKITGTRAERAKVNHTYTGPGTFTVVLNVTDRHGVWAVKTSQITVNPVTQPPTPPLYVVYLPYIAGGAVAALLLILYATGILRRPFRPRKGPPSPGPGRA